jgi:hypothetical protein
MTINTPTFTPFLSRHSHFHKIETTNTKKELFSLSNFRVRSRDSHSPSSIFHSLHIYIFSSFHLIFSPSYSYLSLYLSLSILFYHHSLLLTVIIVIISVILFSKICCCKFLLIFIWIFMEFF